MRFLIPLVLGLILSVQPSPTAQTWSCPAGGTITVTYPNGVATIVCQAAPSPQPVNCVGAWGNRTAVTTPACPASGSRTVTYRETFTVTTPAANGGTACAATNGQTRDVPVVESCTPPTQPPGTPNTVTITNATAHTSAGQQALQWTTAGTGNPFSITVEIDGKPTTAVTPPVASRSLVLSPQPTVTTLYLVTFNKRPANTTTWPHTVSSRHVTVVISGGTQPPPATEICGDGIDNNKNGQIDEGCPVTPPPGGGQIGGLPVTTAELGECSAAAHDQHLRDGGDGWRYRVYHDQVDTSALGKGCVYGHEHGDNPAMQTNATVRQWFTGLMGFSARRHGMDEPHNGYKIHVANAGEMNDEGRVNLNATTSMPHMGTGGPARFSVSDHSVEIADWHNDGIHHSYVNTMFATGTRGNPVVVQCPAAPNGVRANAPTKDGLVLGQACKVDSPYEIWSMVATIRRADGTDLLHKFVVPAVFDPITVFNQNNPGELVFAWDARVAQHKNFPNNWNGHRGCAREGYSQVGYHFSGNDTNEEYLLDVRTNRVVSAPNGFTTRLVVGHSNNAGKPPFSSDILQYKKRRDHCDQRAKLSLTN